MRKLLGIVAIFAALVTLPAHAEGKLEPPDLDRYLRWGAFRVRPGFAFSNFGYDNNIFLDDSNKVGDVTGKLSPKLDGLVLFGSRAFFTFREQFDYTAYLENTDQNILDHRGRGRITVPFGKLAVFTQYRLNRVNQRPQDQEDIRPLTRDRRIGFGVAFEFGWRTEVEVSDTAAKLRFTDDDNPSISDRLDRDERRRALSIGYLLKGRTKLTLDVETADIEFATSRPQKDSDELRLLPGFALGKGGPLRGEFRLGWGWIDAINPERPDFSEAIGDLKLVYVVGGGTRLEFEGERVPGFTVIGEQTYFVSTGGSVRGIRFLNPLVGVEAGMLLGRLVFPESGSAGSDRVDRLKEFDVGIRLRLSKDSLDRRTEYSIRLVRSDRVSTQESFNRSRTTLTVGTVFGF